MLLETWELTKRYGATAALQGVTLKADAGEFISVLGPSGSGKSTLLRLLDLLEEQSSGRILIEGVDTRGSERERLLLRRRIGMVFQQSALFDTTVYKNVAYPLRVRGFRVGVEGRVSEIIRMVGLEGLERRRATTLSGGERQRVSLAQALVYEPDLLLLDEPTANLDPRNAGVIEEAVSRINRDRGVTVIMATHNILQARLAPRVAVLREGRLVQSGPTEDAFRDPSIFFASFTRMGNLYSGRAEVVEEGITLVDLGGEVKIEAAANREGDVNMFVRPEDIIVSTRPISGSARNTLRGRVTEVTDMGQQVQLKVDVGREFAATITKRSFKEMGLNLESEVYLIFKASQVHVF
ncbi:MAG: ABC transporter ATP-binding protein [Candidatus Bathyarchaeia archaeon]